MTHCPGAAERTFCSSAITEQDQLLLLITCVGDERLIFATRRLREDESASTLIRDFP